MAIYVKVIVYKSCSEGCDTFGPKRIWSPDIWSPTIGPQLIGPSGQTVPNQFSPHGQMVPKNSVPVDKWSPTNLVPMDKWSLEYSFRPGGQAVGIQKYGDQIGWGPFVHGDKSGLVKWCSNARLSNIWPKYLLLSSLKFSSCQLRAGCRQINKSDNLKETNLHKK